MHGMCTSESFNLHTPEIETPGRMAWNNVGMHAHLYAYMHAEGLIY